MNLDEQISYILNDTGSDGALKDAEKQLTLVQLLMECEKDTLASLLHTSAFIDTCIKEGIEPEMEEPAPLGYEFDRDVAVLQKIKALPEEKQLLYLVALLKQVYFYALPERAVEESMLANMLQTKVLPKDEYTVQTIGEMAAALGHGDFQEKLLLFLGN